MFLKFILESADRTSDDTNNDHILFIYFEAYWKYMSSLYCLQGVTIKFFKI